METTETHRKPKPALAKEDWKETALNVGGRALELIFTGLILGSASALGSRIATGGSTKVLVKNSEGNLIPMKRVGSV